MKWIIFVLCIGAAFLAATVRRRAELREERTCAERCRMLGAYRRARAERMQWLAEHPFPLPALVDTELEELWLVEIGAEAALEIMFPETVATSWAEYRAWRACDAEESGSP